MMLFVKRHPLEILLPTRGARMAAVTVFAIATIWMSWIMQRLVRGVEPGIVRLELAVTPERARAIIEQWGIGGEARMLAQIGLDNWWLALYSTTLAILCVMVAIRVRKQSPLWSDVGRWLAWGMWIAALFDRIENFALVRTINHGPMWLLTITATFCAALKFALILASLLYVVGSPFFQRLAFFSHGRPRSSR
jgi:hypothetical protein